MGNHNLHLINLQACHLPIKPEQYFGEVLIIHCQLEYLKWKWILILNLFEDGKFCDSIKSRYWLALGWCVTSQTCSMTLMTPVTKIWTQVWIFCEKTVMIIIFSQPLFCLQSVCWLYSQNHQNIPNHFVPLHFGK